MKDRTFYIPCIIIELINMAANYYGQQQRQNIFYLFLMMLGAIQQFGCFYKCRKQTLFQMPT